MILREYAMTLFDEASKDDKLDDVMEEFDLLIDVLDEVNDYYKFVMTPSIRIEDKVKFLNETLTLETACFKNFITFIIERNRFIDIFLVYQKFVDLYDDLKGILRVDLYSIKRFSKSEIKSIEESLSKHYQKKVRLFVHLEKYLIGGFKMVVGGKTFDQTIIKNLESLKSAL